MLPQEHTSRLQRLRATVDHAQGRQVHFYSLMAPTLIIKTLPLDNETKEGGVDSTVRPDNTQLKLRPQGKPRTHGFWCLFAENGRETWRHNPEGHNRKQTWSTVKAN